MLRLTYAEGNLSPIIVYNIAKNKKASALKYNGKALIYRVGRLEQTLAVNA